jgi:CheY-like chemotaxis protein
MQILVVDDDDGTRGALASLLQGEGYRVATCATGAEALARLSEAPFDVLLTDQIMAGMTGLELVELARAARGALRCFVMSGHAPPGGTHPEGVTWIGKPIDLDGLLGALGAGR